MGKFLCVISFYFCVCFLSPLSSLFCPVFFSFAPGLGWIMFVDLGSKASAKFRTGLKT